MAILWRIGKYISSCHKTMSFSYFLIARNQLRSDILFFRSLSIGDPIDSITTPWSLIRDNNVWEFSLPLI